MEEELLNLIGEYLVKQVKELIKIFRENCRAKNSQFEPFALQCRGHQTRYASLLREKIKRQKKEKASASRKRSLTKLRHSTRKSPRRNNTTKQDEK